MKKIFFLNLLIFLFTLFLYADENQAKKYFSDGNKAFKRGQYNKAITCFKKVTEIVPNSDEAYYNLGVVYIYNGNLNEAEKYLKKAIEINPKFEQAHYNLGLVFYRKNKLNEAKNEFQKALSLKPNDKESLMALKQIKKKEKPKKEVKKEIKKEVPKKIVEKKVLEKKPEGKVVKLDEKKEIKSTFIKRIITCKDVKNREPMDETTVFSSKDKEVNLFIELVNVIGEHNLKVCWCSPQEKLSATTTQKINSNGSRYRTWFNITRFRIPGEWKVNVYLDEKKLTTYRFSYK